MTAAQKPGAPRFRLRFQLQEFSLVQGETFIGRNHDCQITIFDPLISRRHARIRVVADHAILEDLGSRNGCRVNGVLIKAPRTLVAGDRIRIGKHELVFSEVTEMGPPPRERQTGSLVFCASCNTVYSEELGMCPSCSSRDALNEDTRSGVFDEQGKESWAIDLLLELFNKALNTDRLDEADRVMRQAMASLEAILKAGGSPNEQRLAPVAAASIRLSEAQKNGFWVHWAAEYYERSGIAVPATLMAATSHWDSHPKSGEQT